MLRFVLSSYTQDILNKSCSKKMFSESNHKVLSPVPIFEAGNLPLLMLSPEHWKSSLTPGCWLHRAASVIPTVFLNQIIETIYAEFSYQHSRLEKKLEELRAPAS